MTTDLRSASVAAGRGRARASRLSGPLLIVALLLSACGTPTEPMPLTLERLETESDAPYATAFGAYIRGDAAVSVCGVASPRSLTVVVDASGRVVPEEERTGISIRFRVPDLGPVGRDCDVEVEQLRGDGVEKASLSGALAYRPWLPLEGARVLMYANINAGEGDNNARARFASAVASVEAAQQIDLTTVDGTPEAYLAGDVARAFAQRLASETWDAIVFIEELYIVPTSVLVEVGAYVAEPGRRGLASYWATFEDGEFTSFGRPAGSVGGPARDFAAAFGAQVTPTDNVLPVLGGSIDVTLEGALAVDLDGAYRLVNDGYYALAYAQRLTPMGTSRSLCVYDDDLAGSCAVGNGPGTTLYLGFTLAPLSETMTGAELETLFRNAVQYVVLVAD